MHYKEKICAVILTVMLLVSLTACGSSTLKGTYTSQSLISQTFTFDGNNVTMSAFGVNACGTYKILGNQIEITYSMLGSEYTWTQPFSQSGNAINIGGTDVVRQK